ncbi:MAG TPA: hypothetical protein VHA82_14670 [Ramlibacter sp.]|uniref:hypothetical protein n=1 Tax=Ramlibacter sp. TaxID=1917967 RepID=UPI002C2214BE|nr:hypothetical protein [Ramlibacter sp.]HVZ45051.1 hypothetical protein [Ramlibacter sp.]
MPGFNFDNIGIQSASQVQSAQDDLDTAVDNVSPDATPKEMLALDVLAQKTEFKTSEWASIVKMLGDIFKGIIQKAN